MPLLIPQPQAGTLSPSTKMVSTPWPQLRPSSSGLFSPQSEYTVPSPDPGTSLQKTKGASGLRRHTLCPPTATEPQLSPEPSRLRPPGLQA